MPPISPNIAPALFPSFAEDSRDSIRYAAKLSTFLPVCLVHKFM